MDLDDLATFYGDSDELQLAFNFPFMFAGLDAAAIADVVKRTEEVLPSGCLAGVGAVESRRRQVPDEDLRRRRREGPPARSSPCSRYGVHRSCTTGTSSACVRSRSRSDRVLDVHGRDGARTPMPWGDVEWRAPWLPIAANVATVAEQEANHRPC